MENIISLVQILIWPITVLIIVFTFKKNISKIIDRLSSVKYNKLTAEFSESISGIEDKAREIEIPNKETKNENLEDRLLQINEISPKAAVFDAWAEIETTAAKLGSFMSGTVQKRLNIGSFLGYLENNLKLKKEEINIINDLRIARNRATHLPDQYISYYDGLKYIKTAVKVVDMINFHQSIDVF